MLPAFFTVLIEGDDHGDTIGDTVQYLQQNVSEHARLDETIKKIKELMLGG